MPVYEYMCSACEAKFSILVGVVAEDESPECPKCGCGRVRRLVSSFARGKDSESALSELAEEEENLDPHDVTQVKSWAKRFSAEMGPEGAELEEYIDSQEFESEVTADPDV